MSETGTRARTLVVGTAVAGALVAIVLGFLTFGAQVSAQPHRLPVAVAVPGDAPPPLHAAAERVAATGGEALEWRVVDPADGRALLVDQDVYGVLELGVGRDGLTITAVTSGTVNPAGTQIAGQAVATAGQRIAGALGETAVSPPVRTETIHDTGPAGRTAPLGISALAWVGGLAGSALLAVQVRRGRLRPGTGARCAHLALTGALLTGVLAGFLALWNSSWDLGWPVLGFLALTATAFVAVQGALLRWLGLPAMAVLGPLYLLAPSVASQVPETLEPAYRVLLWSWTPLRFPAEGLRSLLAESPGTDQVIVAVWVLGAMLVVGVGALLWPRRNTERGSAGEEAEPDAADGVVDVGVDETDRLPRAQGESPAEHRHGRVRR
ncbi:hypothetical protein LY15_001156 [Prauserella flava]|uniref:Uncharacterized protein n=1 Tax=Prauserella sediminis TaxID=577680 RepID=A0A839XBC1_9PSEU|nr:hypothetical protein [Prauserella sediminis]MCR3719195.1 hypothetical protein [Prauserella flava]MCR3735792.1 hypothetical protein [Prauserella salsuginis]